MRKNYHSQYFFLLMHVHCSGPMWSSKISNLVKAGKLCSFILIVSSFVLASFYPIWNFPLVYGGADRKDKSLWGCRSKRRLTWLSGPLRIQMLATLALQASGHILKSKPEPKPCRVLNYCPHKTVACNIMLRSYLFDLIDLQSYSIRNESSRQAVNNPG